MWRSRAVRSLLVDRVAAIRVPEETAEGEAPDDDPEEVRARQRAREMEELDRAQRKAGWMVGLCWVALGILLGFHHQRGPFFSFQGEDLAFSAGVLVVAIYSGYRLGQWEKYRSVSRAVRELDGSAD